MNGTDSTPWLRATGLTLSFGGVKALDGVDIALEPGARLGLIGPNGSGKTTLLNVLSGMYRADAGSIVIGSREMVRTGPGRRARRGVVRTFQHPLLAPSLTILENVMVGARLSRRFLPAPDGPGGDVRTRCVEMLGLFGCSDHVHQLPGEAPYGIRKMAEVARAAVAGPPVLLLDEPAAGLSSSERRELVRALKEFGDRHPRSALCLVEHDVPLVSALCDRLMVLNAGALLSSGETTAVLRDDRVRAAYLGPATRDDGTDGSDDRSASGEKVLD
ncbi:ABC transporter ATP-binding protein [Streptomyces hirsutus]|uniref:ABC transporter ATP-binding protein n=1 Tax=Streptomyces hirsutus TaxID=35620 RepID=UPI0036A94723